MSKQSQSTQFSGYSRRKFLKYSSLAIGTGILASCSGGASSTGDEDLGENPIKVGVMYSTTGTIAIVEKSLQDATFLALEQINTDTGPGKVMVSALKGGRFKKLWLTLTLTGIYITRCRND